MLGISPKKPKKKTERDELIEIFELYHKPVYKYIYYRIGDQVCAEDLTSQVFEKVISKYGTYDKEKGNLEAWVIGIAKNSINDYLRQQKKWHFTTLDKVIGLKSKAKTPEEKIVDQERSTDLKMALNTLTEKERSIVSLKYGAELTNIEIAKIMGLTETNVGSILYRTMRKLKSQMEKENILWIKKA